MPFDALTFGTPSPPPSPEQLWQYGALHVAFGVAVLAALGWWWRSDRSLRPALAASVLAVPLFGAAWWSFDPTRIPVDWLVPLQEGGSREAAFHLYNRSFHAEMGYRAVLHWTTASDVHGLREAVAVNLWFLSVSSVGFAALTWAVCRSGLAVVALTAVFLGNRLTVNAVLSETPAAYLTLVIVATVPLALLLRPDRSRATRALGLVGVGLSTLVLGAARTEMAMPGLGMLAMALTYSWWDRWALSAVRILRWPLDWWASQTRHTEVPRLSRWEQRAVMLGIVLFCFSWWTLPHIFDNYPVAGFFGRLNPLVQGLVPFDPSIGYLPDLLVTAMPLGAIAVLVAGVARTVLEPRWYGLLPLTLLVLFRTYMHAGHLEAPGSWEYYRYTPMLLGYLLVLLPQGWVELRRWPRVHAGAVAAMIVPWPGMIGHARETGWLYTRNMQREVRALAHTIEDNPDCAVVVPIDPDLSGAPPKPDWELIVLGARLPDPITVSGVAGDIPGLVDYVRDQNDEPRLDCVLAWTSVDCSQVRAECPDLGEGPTVTHYEWQNLPWSEVHVGPHEKTVSVGARRLR